MRPVPRKTTPEERQKVLDDMHYNLLMHLFVGASGLRQLLNSKAFGETPPGVYSLPTALKNAKKFLRFAGDDLIQFTAAHPEYYQQTLDAAERATEKEPLLGDFEKKLRRSR